jgi:hypothetical protein
MSAKTVKFSPKESSASERRRELEEQAKELAREQIAEFHQALLKLHWIAEEISQGGESFPVGIREICRNVVGHTETWAKTSELLKTRAPKK